MIFYPQRNFPHIDAVRCHIQPKTYQFFLRVRQIHTVLAKNQQQRRHADALVSVHKAMILHQPTAAAFSSMPGQTSTPPNDAAARFSALSISGSERTPSEPPVQAISFSCSRKTCYTDGSQTLIWPVPQTQADSR